MKKFISGFSFIPKAYPDIRYLLIFFILLSNMAGYAQKTSTGNGDWNNAATWTPAGVPIASDNVIINAGHNVRVNTAANCANMTINGTLRLDGNSITVAGNWTNNGTFTCQQQNNTNETVTFTGAAATIGGTSVTSFSGLRINSPGTVTINSNSINIGTSQHFPGRITLQNGVLDVGVGHSINLVSQNGVTIDASGGGNFKSYGPGGWTLNTAMGFGNILTTSGRVTFDNISPLASWGNNQYAIQNNTVSSATTGLQLNGFVRVSGPQSQQWRIQGNPPVWGPSSTLYIDRQNQPFALGQNGDQSWIAMASGTIGVTPGYPNNVTLVNMGNSAGDGAGWYPSGSLAINGALSIGDGTTNGSVSLSNVTSFTSGGIILDNNSTLKSPNGAATFVNKGDFILKGATTGVYQNNGANINFAGSGTVGSPQVISTTGASILLTNITVSNGTYVQLQDPVSVSGTVTLTSGKIGTTTTNILTLNNNATNAITGGNANTYVDGPLSWSVKATTTDDYTFPVGSTSNGGAYLPLTLSPNSTSGGTVTVTAFNNGSGGTRDNTITTLSQTEYWSVATTTPFTSGAFVSVSRPIPVGTYNALATSTTASGIYTAKGGIASGNSISGAGIGTSSPVYIAMANAPLSVVRAGGTNLTCDGTVGSLVVGGSGGVPPYSFSMDGGPFNAVALPATTYEFINVTPGYHEIVVRDNNGEKDTTQMDVLGSLQINNGADSVFMCVDPVTTLTAVNYQNTTPTFSWSTSPTGVPVIGNNPTYDASTTGMYYVTSNLYASNLLVNGSFESGNVGFSTSYTHYTGAQYATTPGNNGYYSISNAGINQCQYFSTTGVANQPSLTAQDGGLYFIGDGATASSMVYSQTIAGLTIGNVYKFQFWYAAGNPDATKAVLRTAISGGTLTAVAPTGSTDLTTTNPTAWTQATYSFTATATSATITITNLTATGSTNGNDFFLDNMEFLEPCTVKDSIKVSSACMPLPVELMYFNVIRQGTGALLNWATVTERNSSYFIIEKSEDGVSFYPIGKINAAGNSFSTVTYAFTDPAIDFGVTYYRLAQYDMDGTVHYSTIKSISKEGLADVQIVPNPTNGVFEIILENSGESETHISITNSVGQLIYEVMDATNVLTVDISNLASGIYYLHAGSDNGRIVKKIVKEEF